MRYWESLDTKEEKIRIVAASYFNDNKKRYKYCQSFISSILAQTYENFELIIVHDGPINDCQEKISLLNFIESDNRIKIIETENRLGKFGYPHRKKYAFMNEDFQWLIYTNDDNYYVPTALESLIATAQEYNKKIVFSNMISSHRRWGILETHFVKSHIDLGCLFFDKNIIKDFDFDLSDDCFEADGKLVEEIGKSVDRNNIIKINNYLFIHN